MTSPHEISVRKVAPADFEQTVHLLARAFDDDPVLNFMVKQDARRHERLRVFMDLGLRELTFPFGATYVTGGFEGAALWNPPNQQLHGLWDNLRLFPPFARVTGFRRLLPVMSALQKVENKRPKEPHYYLLAIGVDPAMQGRGVATQLMVPVLEQADRERMPAYLESTKERNVPLYERFGFQVIDRIDLARGGPTEWLMWREPART